MASRRAEKMDHDETGCQAPEGPILCINNCGFFGSAATMYMCSKCHKDLIIKQEQAKIAAASIDSIVSGKEPIITGNLNTQTEKIEMKIISFGFIDDTIVGEIKEKEEEKESPKRCKACKRRVGLSGFTCRCGELFCGAHRYSDKHGCPFDYRMAAQEAIAKANPIVKAEKLDKI